ncbi:MAG: O-antigen ligase family protein [bacterium]
MDHNTIVQALIDAGLILIIAFAPCAFGSVHIWAYTLIELIVFSLLMLWIVYHLIFPKKSLIKKDQKELIPVYAALVLFIVTVCVQIIPLPPIILRFLSPKAYEIYCHAIPGYEKTALSRSLSIYPYASKISLAKFISYAGIFFLITHEIREHTRIKRIIGVLMLIGFFEALYGLYGYFSRNYSIFGFSKAYCIGPATGTYVNRNHFAGFLGMTVFVCIGYLLGKVPIRSRDRYGYTQRIIDFLNTAKASESGLVLIIIITMILGIIFSLSRMGVFSFVLSILLLAFITLVGRQKKFITIIFFIFSLALITSLWYGLNPLVERYYRSEDSFLDRALIWRYTSHLIKDFPLMGAGLGTYETVFQQYKPDTFTYRLSRYDHAHNDYLELIAEVGLSGSIPLFLGSVYFLLLLLKKWAKSNNAFSKGMSLGGIGASFYMSLHSLTDFNLYIPANAMIFFIIMALTYCSVAEV